MLLEDFNYYFNKAVNQYINKRYNIYDVNQQTTDDLRVLKATALLKPVKVKEVQGDTSITSLGAGLSRLFGATYEVNLPLDYLHILNCVCIYKVKKRFKCYDAGNSVLFAAKRLTADTWSVVMNDFYNRPMYKRPYYYIHNVNQQAELPTNPISSDEILDSSTKGTDPKQPYNIKGTAANPLIDSNMPRNIKLSDVFKGHESLVEREAGVRYGNSSNVRMEIRYGNDDSLFELTDIIVDYIKAPQSLRLTQEQVDLTEDTSLMLEWPDYVCQEIINELVTIVMEATADPRLLTHPAVSQSIANPAQQLAPTRG